MGFGPFGFLSTLCTAASSLIKWATLNFQICSTSIVPLAGTWSRIHVIWTWPCLLSIDPQVSPDYKVMVMYDVGYVRRWEEERWGTHVLFLSLYNWPLFQEVATSKSIPKYRVRTWLSIDCFFFLIIMIYICLVRSGDHEKSAIYTWERSLILFLQSPNYRSKGVMIFSCHWWL